VRAKAIAALLAATAIVGALAVPAGASAKPRHLRQKALVSADLHLRGTHGFRLEAKRRKKRERGEFHLVAGDERASVLFQARREEPPKGLHGPSMTFSESVNGRKAGNFSVGYSAFFFFEGDAATVFQAPNLAEATIAPPAPFSGSATFHLEDPKTATWTGDLRVELPGIGKVPLTGEGIGAGLCNGPSNCTKTLPRDLQPVLETSSDEIVAVRVPKKVSS